MKYCEKCQKNLPDNQAFCSDCGSRLIDYIVPENKNNTQNAASETARITYCSNCKKPLSSNQVFCPDCGTRVGAVPNFNQGSYNVPVGNTNENKPNKLNNWIPVIVAGVGAVIGLFLSGLIGFILGCCAVGLIAKQKKEGQAEQLPFILTIVLLVVDIVFWFIAMGG